MVEAGGAVLGVSPGTAARPGGYRVFIIVDNLPVNKTPAIRRWARRENVELCFTPANASWANPIEAQFRPHKRAWHTFTGSAPCGAG